MLQTLELGSEALLMDTHRHLDLTLFTNLTSLSILNGRYQTDYLADAICRMTALRTLTIKIHSALIVATGDNVHKLQTGTISCHTLTINTRILPYQLAQMLGFME